MKTMKTKMFLMLLLCGVCFACNAPQHDKQGKDSTKTDYEETKHIISFIE